MSAAVLLATLTGGVGSAHAQAVTITVPAPVVVAPAVTTDTYVYYPQYGVYYNSYRHRYNYMKDNVWVAGGAPEGVSVSALQASPSVNMDFHDSPEKHHAEILKKYPREWKPSAERQDQKEDRKDAAPDHDKK
jgi:hypothetical protein